MITPQEIGLLEKWTQEGDASEEVKAWHAQIVFELISYIRYLELENVRLQGIGNDLDEENRFLKEENRRNNL